MVPLTDRSVRDHARELIRDTARRSVAVTSREPSDKKRVCAVAFVSANGTKLEGGEFRGSVPSAPP